MTRYTIKPLEWRRGCNPCNLRQAWETDMVEGPCDVYMSGREWRIAGHIGVGQGFHSAEAAKAVVERIHAESLLRFLEPAEDQK